MNRMFTKLTGVGVALALCLMGTTAWVNAQANDQAVTDSMLLSDPAASWLHTNGNLAGHRYSVLTQLNASNADQLNVAWIFSPGGETDAQNTPLYHDGIVYFAQDNTVFAIDARSGRRVWKYEHELPETFGGYNVDFITGKHRGVAIYGDYIYFLSNDSKLHAIHYKTGEQKFVKQYLHYPEDFERTEDGDANGYATTVGPTAIPGGQIIVPLNATDFGGLPGFVYGVNPEDGEVLWECNMIPGPGEPGYESWPGDSGRLRRRWPVDQRLVGSRSEDVLHRYGQCLSVESQDARRRLNGQPGRRQCGGVQYRYRPGGVALRGGPRRSLGLRHPADADDHHHRRSQDHRAPEQGRLHSLPGCGDRPVPARPGVWSIG